MNGKNRSDMNYEQKYKEVLQKAKEEYNRLGKLGNESMKRGFEVIFPELAESEDERIRKEINILYSEIETCITELLKARTDKDSEAEGKARFKMEGLMVATLEDLSRIEAYLEEQKEQKPQDQSVDVIKMSALLAADRLASAEMTERLKVRKEILENPEKYGLCKPVEWSEEDGKTINDAIRLIERYAIDGHKKALREDVINRLKSLRPQPKIEWSKKDKKIVRALQHALNCADAQNAITKSGIEVSEVATFLQDLIPSWKPSEEQPAEEPEYYQHFDPDC